MTVSMLLEGLYINLSSLDQYEHIRTVFELCKIIGESGSQTFSCLTHMCHCA